VADEIPADQVVPDPVSVNEPQSNTQSSSPAEIPQDQVIPDPEKDESLGRQIGAGLEGIAKGAAGPVATAAELGLSKLGVPGLSAEEQTSRAEDFPITHGAGEAVGLVGAPFIPGLGEWSLATKAAEAANIAAKTAELGKFGSAGIKLATEGGLFGLSNNLDKAMLGQGDPEHPVAAALADMAAGGLGGVVLGGAAHGLGAGAKAASKFVTDSAFGQKAGQFLSDLGNQLKFNKENPNMVDAVTSELRGLHTNSSDGLYGQGGLKNKAIETLSPEISPENVSRHVNEIEGVLRNAPKAVTEEPVFKDALESWRKAVTPTRDFITNQPLTEPSAGDVFKATDLFKRQLQEWAEYNKHDVKLSEIPFRNGVKSIASIFRESLENRDVWGRLGELQQGVNQAISDFKPKQNNFLKKFAEIQNGKRVVTNGKVNTYLKQLETPTGVDKKQILDDYINSAENKNKVISNLHERFGVDAPPTPVSLNATKSTLNKAPSFGMKLANQLSGMASHDAGGKLLDSIGVGEGFREGYREHGFVGGLQGAMVGGLGAHFSPMLMKKAGSLGTAALLRVLGSGNTAGITDVMEHAGSVSRGAKAMKESVDSLFSFGGQKAGINKHTEKDREKLKKFIESGALNQQIQDLPNQSTGVERDPSSDTQAFAHGGDVHSKVQTPIPQPTAQESDSNGVATHFPEQHMLLQAAKGRINNYLNSIRPLPSHNRLPFDRDIKDHEKERSYNKAIDIANQPLSILDHLKKGTMTIDHLKHFTQMYPEIHNQLSKNITEKITDHQMNEEKPSYRVRQGLSMFLAHPLESSMTPAGIMAAQSVFMKQKAQAQAPQQVKKGTAKMDKIADNYETSDQAAQKRSTAER
jgi:hypothetical protein